MKKGKFGKGQIALAVMVLALGAAVWLNMKYTSAPTKTSETSSKYLGQAEYVSNEVKEDETDYFSSVRSERKKSREEAIDIIEETLKSENLTDADKKSAVEKAKQIADAIDKEATIEALLKTKGFKNAVAVLGENDINIIVKAETLTPAETVQIKDVVTAQTGLSAANIKIITSK